MSRSPMQEIAVSQGREYSEAFRAVNRMVNEGMSWSGNERNRCFLNTSSPRFADVSALAGFDFLDDARAIAQVDWDQDGDTDLFLNNRTGPQLRFLRNDWGQQYSWLAIQLVGRTCNRDAIGARVELFREESPGRLVRSLRASNSFLSQSTKWVHFGLGDTDQVDKVVVHWPGQAPETFLGLQPNSRFRLVQGSGQAVQVPARSGPVRLAAGQLPSPVKTDQARVILGQRVPLPPLDYETWNGEPIRLQTGRPTLVQLWASWCPMCQAELAEFTKRSAELQAVGVRVLSLSVDGLGNDESNVQNAIDLVQRFGLPFVTGHGTEALLTQLETIRGELFSNLRPFPIPTSLLLDERGRLCAVYLGPVTVDQLLSDVGKLAIPADRLRDLAAPFPGRWFTEPLTQRLMPLAQAMAAAGFTEGAAWYRQHAGNEIALGHCNLALDLERQGKPKAARDQYQQAIATDPHAGRVHQLFGKFLMRQREFDAAEQALRRAIELDDSLAEAHFHLATVFVLRKNIPAAIGWYRRAVAVDPDYAEAQTALGRLLQQQGQIDDAVRHLREAIRSNPRLAAPYVYLGWISASRRDLDEGVRLLRQAVQLQPELVDAHEKLGDVLIARGDFPAAVESYRRCVELAPQLPSPTFKLAWHLSTQTTTKKKTETEAIELAQRLVAATQQQAPQMLDLLGATLADAGRYPQAIRAAEQALQLHPDNPLLVKAIRARLEGYRQGRPFRSRRGGGP